jgi:hypothetical protein
MYAVGLALCTFANIASEEMARDLCNEIEKLLGSSNTYIRKKVSWLLIDPLCLFPTKFRLPYVPSASLERFQTSMTISSKRPRIFSTIVIMGSSSPE